MRFRKGDSEMDLSELITQNADRFADIPDAGTVAGNLAAKVKELGFSVLVDNPKEPGYVPKARLDEVIGQRKQYEGQVGDLTKQLDELKKSVKGNEELTAQINDLQAKLGESDGRIKAVTLESAVKLAAVQEQAKDPADILKFLDLSKLSVSDDGTVQNLADQFKALKESKPYLFGDGTSKGGGDLGGGNGNEEPLTEEKIKAMSPAEYSANIERITRFYKSKRGK